MYLVVYVGNNECACHDEGGVKIKCLEVLKGVKGCKFACGMYVGWLFIKM